MQEETLIPVTTEVETKKTIWGKVPGWILYILLPIVFFFCLNSSSYSDNEINRKFTLLVGLSLFLVSWVIARLIDGKFVILRGATLFTAITVAVVTMLSTLFSPAKNISFFGYGYETNTAGFIILLFVTFLVSLQVISENNSRKILTRIIGSFSLVLVLLQLIKAFVPSMLFGLGSNLQTFVGKWNDMGILSAAVLIYSLSFLEFSTGKIRDKYFHILVAIVSLVGVIITNFDLLWWVLGAITLIIFVYGWFRLNFSTESNIPVSRTKKILRPSLLLLVVCAIFIIFGGQSTDGKISKIATAINTRFPKPVEVRPWKSTFGVYKESIKENKYFGVGPNRFSNVWNLAKDPQVNRTPFWGVDFANGVGNVPTFVSTTGLLGTIAWLLFLLSVIYYIARGLFGGGIKNPAITSENIGLALVLLLFWVMMVCYIPDGTLTFLSFLIFALLLILFTEQNTAKLSTIETLKRPILGFVAVLALIVLGILTIAYGYTTISQWRSVSYFQQGVKIYSSGDFVKSIPLIKKSIEIRPTDVYYRELALEKLSELNKFLSENQQSDVEPDILRSKFATLYQEALEASKNAVDYDQTNYQNWLTRASVFEVTVPLKIEGAYEQATAAYKEAQKLSPLNPLIYFRLARLDFAVSKKDSGVEYLKKSLELKQDYIDSLYLAAQLDLSEGNVKSAIRTLENAVLLNPGNVGVLFQLGYVKYSSNDFDGAIDALEKALSISPDFANAKYFLGLSYGRLGQTEKALPLFQELNKLDPTNEQVKKIIDNLQSGKPVLSGLAGQSNTAENPPVKEK